MSRKEEKSPQRSREERLIRQACNGHKDAFYELIQPHQRSVFVAAMSILRNPADAEDAAQEAILKALSHLSQFRHESKFSTWLIQITINEARLKIRKDRRHLYESVDANNVDENGEQFAREIPDRRDTPSDSLQRRELRATLQRGLAKLSQKYREVLVLRDIQHLTVRETARVLHLTEGSVKTRLLRARLQMREALGADFYRAGRRRAQRS